MVNALSSARDNTVVTLQVSANANYTLGATTQANVTISSPNAGAFGRWQQQYFDAQASSPDAAPTADYDYDGLVNLLEYALAKDPTLAQNTPAYVVGVDANRLTLSFSRVLQPDPKLTLRVLASNTLVTGSSWTTLATKIGGGAWTTASSVSVTDNATTGAVTVADVETTTSQPQRFLRITAELAGD